MQSAGSLLCVPAAVVPSLLLLPAAGRLPRLRRGRPQHQRFPPRSFALANSPTGLWLPRINACARIVHSSSAVVAGTASAKLGGVVTTYNQSRDHGEQRLGSYLDTRSDPNIYVRYRARRRHRDPDSSAPRFHWQPRCPDDGYTHPSDCLPLFVRYLPLLPHL